VDRHDWLRAFACAGLCAALNWQTSKFSLGGVSFHPGLAAVTFAGAAFGPASGFIAGAAGTAMTDLLTGSLWWNWDVAMGLSGLVAGLWYRRRSRAGTAPITWHDLMLLLGHAVIGNVVAIYAGGLSDMAMGAPYATAIGTWALPAALSNALMGVLAVPFVLLAWRGQVPRGVDGQRCPPRV